MSEEIRSVLTAEEWEEGVIGFAETPEWAEWGYSGGANRTPQGVELGTNGEVILNPQDCARLGAFLLQHAGPDGGPLFTWEDVDFLRRCAVAADDDSRHGGLYIPSEVSATHRDLAARLASLLPPHTEP